jgi:hypothetical protein
MALAESWNEFIALHPYEFVLNSQGGGVYLLQVWQTQPMPAAFSIAMGEWLYNLRSALDYVVWATAVCVSGQSPPPKEGVLQYPVYDSEAAWKANRYRLDVLREHHVAMLETMQPFRSDLDANYLGWINRLARVDRHRRLVDGTAYLAELEPVLAVPSGVDVTLEWGERVLVNGHADVARITLNPWREDMEVSVNPRIGIDPEVREWASSPFWGPKRFTERLRLLQIFVSGEIATYEYDCTGQSRKQHLLTDTYRAECDARREPKEIHVAARPPVSWKVSKKGRPASREMLRGDDKPRGPHPA